MTVMTSHFDQSDRSTLNAMFRSGQIECTLRYRGIAYLRADLRKDLPAVCDGMIYRGVRFRSPLSNPAPAPAAGRRRYRGVAF